MKGSTQVLLARASILILLVATGTQGQEAASHFGISHLQDLETRFGPHFASRLSSGGASAFRSAKALSRLSGSHFPPQLRQHLEDLRKIQESKSSSRPNSSNGDTDLPVQANEASFDYDATRLSGFTQSETSSAWCGDNIVVGYNDSSAWAHTALLHQAPAISLSGIAVSHDKGRSFHGLPFLNPGPGLNSAEGFFDSELSGDPVVVCSDQSHFVYSSLQIQIPVDSQGNPTSAFAQIAINRSSDGGDSWNDPIVAVQKDLNSHFLDKEWLAIDPQNPNNLYLTYTDFQAHGTESDCAGGSPGVGLGPDVSLEIVSSKDGGITWNLPVRLARQCSLDLVQNLSGTQVVVGRSGQLSVVYAAAYTTDGRQAEIHFRRSEDGGVTFGPEVTVGTAAIASNPISPQLQGNFRTNVFPSLAVDNSGGPHNGMLYVAWTDASRTSASDIMLDFFGVEGGYSFGEIVFSSSSDNGKTWKPSKLVSPTPARFKGNGRDQFMAGAAVDKQGNLSICYSDRRNDPNNFRIDHYCSISHDFGMTFRDIRETPESWTPTEFTDGIINKTYMGDYDTVSSDSTGVNYGFFNTFQIQRHGNPDVFGLAMKP